MIISTKDADLAMDVSLYIYERTGKKYEPHSTGLISQYVTDEHASLIREKFSGRGVWIDGKAI